MVLALPVTRVFKTSAVPLQSPRTPSFVRTVTKPLVVV
ncbi:hypothetical protein TELCIR_14747 [Teladorsagia circumcincta]|uniref:Uncharacterized protein n=1 Tax=Teladorsagia circumcincta TaxID=45464 RepID=A0A2G9U046_TELCI|nr:hypothetical protein TELCIR_14747 [Teladorsagia circumcincta]